jgi:L-aspartate oxidase
MSGAIRVIDAPAVVVGAGVAGLSAALSLGRAVVLADAAPGAGGSSPWAQGGMAAAIGERDSAAAHAADTVAAGAGLVDEAVAELVTAAGPELVRWLDALGARLDRDGGGDLSLHREAAHSAHRIVHHRDATGAELTRTLADKVAVTPGVDVLPARALDLLIARSPRGERAAAGVLARTAAGELVAVVAPAVVIATGGYAHLWAATTTPAQAVGDGVAMAARAGVALADLEFVQFHPTALDVAADPKPLLTEALRGEGALLVDEAGEGFVDELAPRDVVARAIYRHLAAGHRCYLDARGVAGVHEHFPTVAALAARHGLDPATDLLPVTPVTHYCMGGIATDAWGRTSLARLWAAGEVASTGLHGANRLASNSLLEGMVMGRQVAADILAAPTSAGARPAAVEAPAGAVDRGAGDPDDVLGAVRRILWARAGVERDGDGLHAARCELARLAPLAAGSIEGANALLVAELVVDAALARTESRGAHTRRDFPDLDPTQASRRTMRLEPSPGPTWSLTAAGLEAQQVSVAA